MFFALLMGIAFAEVSVAIINNTRFEFDVGAQVKPYFANEVVLNPHDFNMVMKKNKFRIGVRHKTSDHIKLDPHIFIQNQRVGDWAFEYGSALRLDVSF